MLLLKTTKYIILANSIIQCITNAFLYTSPVDGHCSYNCITHAFLYTSPVDGRCSYNCCNAMTAIMYYMTGILVSPVTNVLAQKSCLQVLRLTIIKIP